jgi:hypothetical protein
LLIIKWATILIIEKNSSILFVAMLTKEPRKVQALPLLLMFFWQPKLQRNQMFVESLVNYS